MDPFFMADHPYNQAHVKTSIVGGTDLVKNGKTLAHQQPGVHPGVQVTYENGEHVAATKVNAQGNVDIYQDGHHTGTIAHDVTGKTVLYDSNHQKLATVDPQGNLQKIMTHPDPLSQVDRINLQQLKFHTNQ